MTIHFEDLWEKCEQLHQSSIAEDLSSTIIDELMMKINLYKMIDSKTEVGENERNEAKQRTMGEILLTITKLSLKDNINVFEALSISQQYKQAENSYKKIPPELRIPRK